jgi:hypothetical protein
LGGAANDRGMLVSMADGEAVGKLAAPSASDVALHI